MILLLKRFLNFKHLHKFKKILNSKIYLKLKQTYLENLKHRNKMKKLIKIHLNKTYFIFSLQMTYFKIFNVQIKIQIGLIKNLNKNNQLTMSLMILLSQLNRSQHLNLSLINNSPNKKKIICFLLKKSSKSKNRLRKPQLFQKWIYHQMLF